ncbi:uncharacterized protein LOC122528291 [Frieseomelitta varia]|uniref:uncharacterized protein LOC122528291 n=1 Tax=Frieseomelitta varia TaxID=561572 RepID=UPI001CB6A81D|nr:uncharacterized protein LOC122528291 [Frieseomelitta varia]
MLRALHLISWPSLPDALAASVDRMQTNQLFVPIVSETHSEECSYSYRQLSPKLFVSIYFVSRRTSCSEPQIFVRGGPCFRGFQDLAWNFVDCASLIRNFVLSNHRV